jgi:hypothetical protein
LVEHGGYVSVEPEPEPKAGVAPVEE